MIPTAVIHPTKITTILNGVSAPEIRTHLDLILRSRVFIQSHRIRRFLQFIVEESLLGQPHRLKEYPIGLEVFDRREAFDPSVSTPLFASKPAGCATNSKSITAPKDARTEFASCFAKAATCRSSSTQREYANLCVSPSASVEIAPLADFVNPRPKPPRWPTRSNAGWRTCLIKEGCFQVTAKSLTPAQLGPQRKWKRARSAMPLTTSWKAASSSARTIST